MVKNIQTVSINKHPVFIDGEFLSNPKTYLNQFPPNVLFLPPPPLKTLERNGLKQILTL